jgi:hypothetical protein
VLARWPNAPWNPGNWSKVLHSSPSGPANRTLGPDDATLARAARWAQQFAEDPGSVFVHQYNRVGWADMHWRLEGLTARNMTFGVCGNMSVGEHAVQTGNYFTTYNLLSELDEPGEFYVNRTSRVLYAWLPAGAAPDANGTAGWASILEEPVLKLDGVAGATWTNASFRYGRGVGVSCSNCTDVTLQGCEVSRKRAGSEPEASQKRAKRARRERFGGGTQVGVWCISHANANAPAPSPPPPKHTLTSPISLPPRVRCRWSV